MKSYYCLRIASLGAFLIALGLGTALAEHPNTGIDPNADPLPPGDLTTDETCSVLYYGPYATGDYNRLVSLGYNLTYTNNPGDLTYVNLFSYNVLVLFLTGPGEITTQQPEIETYISAGGSMLIHQPNAEGMVDYAPSGFEVYIDSRYYDEYDACITDPSHPITMGLTDADLSGDFETVGSLGPGYTRLAENCIYHTPALAAGLYGCGKVVFDTGNFSSTAYDPGSDTYVIQLMDWLCETGPIATEAASWGSVKALYK